MPVPVRLTVCGLFRAVSVNISVPLIVPFAAGVNVTPTVQLAPAARLAPHVLLEIAKLALAVMLEKLRDAPPLLVSVTVLAELAWPTLTCPKFKDVGETVASVLPVPVRLTVCGLFDAESVNVSVPLIVPPAAGEKVTPTVQLAPEPIPPPHVLLAMEKPAVVTMLEKVRAAPAPFVSVTVWGELMLPTATAPKFKPLGETVAGTPPLPVRTVTCGLPAALSVAVKVPSTEPPVVGVNVTPTVQLAPAARLAPQVLLAIAKPALAVMPAMLTDALPPFVRVAVLAALVAPTGTVPKSNSLGDQLTGPEPVPERLTVCVPASSVIVRLPEAEPIAVGVKETWMVQEAPAAMLPMQLLV